MGTADVIISRHCFVQMPGILYVKNDDVFFAMLLLFRADSLKEVNVYSLST